MKVSVIIPIYNVEKYIKGCVYQLLQQSLQDIEYIFVDDCSTDNSLIVLKEELSKYSAIKDHVVLVEHHVNRGVASARNTGLNIACGEYIGWVDADDQFDSRMFEELYSKIEEDNADLIWCDYYNVNGGERDYVTQMEVLDSNICLSALLTGKLMGAMWNKLIRKDLFYNNHIKFPDGLNMSEDLLVSVQLFYHANKISYYRKAFYGYVIGRVNSVSSFKKNVRNHLREDRIENVRGIEKFIRDKCIMGLDHELNILKLMAKKSLLLTSDNVEGFKKWKGIFSEANDTMKKSDFPISYKLLAEAISKEWWWFVKAWIFLKSTIKN